jgi:hypothetical protein
MPAWYQGGTSEQTACPDCPDRRLDVTRLGAATLSMLPFAGATDCLFGSDSCWYSAWRRSTTSSTNVVDESRHPDLATGRSGRLHDLVIHRPCLERGNFRHGYRAARISLSPRTAAVSVLELGWMVPERLSDEPAVERITVGAAGVEHEHGHLPLGRTGHDRSGDRVPERAGRRGRLMRRPRLERHRSSNKGSSASSAVRSAMSSRGSARS